MHANQIWWAWPLRFWRFILFLVAFGYLQNGQISLLDHGVQKIELAKKIHASRAGCKMHANQIWWVGPLRFQRFILFLAAFGCLQKWPKSLSDHGL